MQKLAACLQTLLGCFTLLLGQQGLPQSEPSFSISQAIAQRITSVSLRHNLHQREGTRQTSSHWVLLAGPLYAIAMLQCNATRKSA